MATPEDAVRSLQREAELCTRMAKLIHMLDATNPEEIRGLAETLRAVAKSHLSAANVLQVLAVQVEFESLFESSS